MHSDSERFTADLLTFEQVLEITKQSPATWRRRIANREIATYRLGKNVRIARADLDAYLAAHRTPAKTN